MRGGGGFGARLEACARKTGGRRAQRLAGRIERRARREWPGLSVERESARVSLSGRGLFARILRDPLLRSLKELLR